MKKSSKLALAALAVIALVIVATIGTTNQSGPNPTPAPAATPAPASVSQITLTPERWLAGDTAPAFRSMLDTLEHSPEKELQDLAERIMRREVQLDFLNDMPAGVVAAFMLYPHHDPNANTPTFMVSRGLFAMTDTMMERVLRHEVEHYRQWREQRFPLDSFRSGMSGINERSAELKLVGEVEASIPECDFAIRDNIFYGPDDQCRAYQRGGAQALAMNLALATAGQPTYAPFRDVLVRTAQSRHW